MQPPNWKEVGIPDIMVRTIHIMKPTYALDCLISQMVFHNNKKLNLVYTCDMCAYQYVPQRNTEEVSQCVNCNSKRVRCLQSLKFSNDKKIPFYSRAGNFILQINDQMRNNFLSYFKTWPERDMDWEWHDGIYHVAFAGGETGTGELPRLAIARAALLTPYLWDSMFDWKTASRRDKIDQRFISQYLGHFALSKRE